MDSDVAMSVQRRQAALDRFERAVEVPLLVLALAMLPLLVLPLLVDLPPSIDRAFVAADWFIWAAFAFEYALRFVLTPAKAKFVRRNWSDLLMVALPFLRPLRVVRSARALRVLRLTRLVAVLSKVTQEARRLLVRRKLHYALLVTLVVVVGSAALVLAIEGGGAGNIHTFGDALWWAVTTVTTVGYGDHYPVTAAGRGVAALLMVTGIAFFGVLTANIAAFFMERDDEKKPEEDRLDEILHRLTAIEDRLGDRKAA